MASTWDKWTSGKPTESLALIPAGQEHILEEEDGKKRLVQVVTELSRAFALCAALVAIPSGLDAKIINIEGSW